jgi:hypothetical protein
MCVCCRCVYVCVCLAQCVCRCLCVCMPRSMCMQVSMSRCVCVYRCQCIPSAWICSLFPLSLTLLLPVLSFLVCATHLSIIADTGRYSVFSECGDVRRLDGCIRSQSPTHIHLLSRLPFSLNSGLIFCSVCSSHSCSIPKFGMEKPVRVCDRCYALLTA